ncbi:MAG TPA: SRPBCC family protein [Roseivirga sp.]
MTFQKITIQTSVLSDLQKAWNCYTQPEHITQWNFAHESWCCPSAENDLRVGGIMKSRMEAKDGSFGFDFEGKYSVVEDLKRLVYGLEDGRQVDIKFEDNGNRVNVTIVFDAEGENPIEMQRDGWQAILDNYKKHTEGLG